jgi:alkylhydroperoxidase family enzyme
VRAVLEDYTTAPLSDAEKALFAYIDKLTRYSGPIRREDVENLKQLGWTEEAIYDAVTVCALFSFYNRWIDGTGVQDMPAAAYEMTGQRLKEIGYVSPPKPA